ncbi:MAG: response regulator [Olivibacter sp.]|nr:response regulator [Olivibacter sp. UJ_SKK_5.1]
MKKKIVVLEDDPDIRRIIALILLRENFEVQSYASAAIFLNEMSNMDADVFLLDVKLPDGNGMDICNQLKQDSRTRHIPIIMMSAHYNLAKAGDFIADDFICKPFNITDFVDTIRKHIA